MTSVDERAYYIDLCKTLPTQYLMQIFYPDLYPIHTIEDKVNKFYAYVQSLILFFCL